MMSVVLVFYLLLASLSEAISAQEAYKEPIVHRQFDNPEKDAALAMAAGDISLRGVNRFTTIVPGINADYTILQAKFKITVIENTSDMIVNDPKSYNNMAERYAFAYNRYIFGKLGCDPEKPMDKCKYYR